MSTLTCTWCQRELPDEAFYRNRRFPKRRSRHTYCKECMAAWDLQRQRSCRHCGAPTGTSQARLCPACRPEHMAATARDSWVDAVGRQPHWTRERIIAVIQRHAKKHGKPPTARQWSKSRSSERRSPLLGDEVYREYPTPAVVGRVFGSWNAAIEAAGFEPRPAVLPPGGGRAPLWLTRKKCKRNHPWVEGAKRCRRCKREDLQLLRERRRAQGLTARGTPRQKAIYNMRKKKR